MKKYRLFYYIAIFSFVLSFIACEEEERGPLVTDDTIPSAVTDVTVENLPGGAKITYKIPDGEDILLVEASYERNGEIITARSSVYKNFVVVEGLKKTSPQEVTLRVVDRSNNTSDPVTTTINPKKAPIDKLFESFQLVADFGGVRLIYNNEDNIRAELLLYTIDASGTPTYNQSAFIENDNRMHHTYRSFDPVPVTFGVAAIDRWNNITIIKKAEITPKLEVELDRQEFGAEFLDGDRRDEFGWVIQNLWNGTPNGAGFHTSQIEPGAIIPPYTKPYHMFTMDLGVTAQLSRFKFWPRVDCCGTPFGHGDPRYFEVWGIDELPADNGTSFDGWTRLVENGEVIKPSGAAIGVHSAEDLALANAGFEFEFPIDAPPVRYIRFVNFQNWSGTEFMHVMEVAYWGEIK